MNVRTFATYCFSFCSLAIVDVRIIHLELSPESKRKVLMLSCRTKKNTESRCENRVHIEVLASNGVVGRAKQPLENIINESFVHTSPWLLRAKNVARENEAMVVIRYCTTMKYIFSLSGGS